ncbi:membrane protein [Sporichthya brevicatena]|uniref:Membrane protein n=1 Tax=Sporichthya brevicatena TaxID=171442 RepID=A0ABN1H1W6_9ACTN
MSTQTSPPARVALSRPARRVALVVHIVASGAWLGLEIALGALVLAALATDDPMREAAVLQAIEVVAVGPMIAAGALTLVSGIVLGLGTKWGLLRYRWVAVKLVLNVVLLVLVLVALRPGAAEVAETGRALAAGTASERGPGDLVFPPIVSTIALSFAITLSVVKPWGRLRRG